jgi:hypothetical protein
MTTRHLRLLGGFVGAPEGLVFKPNRDHVACGVCGKVYQHPNSRLDAPTSGETLRAFVARREWSLKHAKTHSSTQHRQLALSGRKVTPEAAALLVTYGVIPLTDIVMDAEHRHAARTAPRAPIDDVEGPTTLVMVKKTKKPKKGY